MISNNNSNNNDKNVMLMLMIMLITIKRRKRSSSSSKRGKVITIMMIIVECLVPSKCLIRLLLFQGCLCLYMTQVLDCKDIHHITYIWIYIFVYIHIEKIYTCIYRDIKIPIYRRNIISFLMIIIYVCNWEWFTCRVAQSIGQRIIDNRE